MALGSRLIDDSEGGKAFRHHAVQQRRRFTSQQVSLRP